MSREIRQKQKYLREENKRFGTRLVDIPQAQWEWKSFKPKEVWRSKDFLVQIFSMQDGAARMTVSRTMIGEDGQWLDGIKWEDLMRLKDECGYGRDWAVEIFPPTANVVDVANMRHLWLIPEAPAYAWNRMGEGIE
jgi:hypothetical protein